MITVRYWLQRLFNIVFKYAEFDDIIFNPKMINLLFDNDKTILKQFYAQNFKLMARNVINENIFEFALKHFEIYGQLEIVLRQDNIIEKYIDILFNIIINEGNKLPKVIFRIRPSRLYDRIIEYVTTSKNVSNIVPTILLNCCIIPNFKLNERAEKIENIRKYGLEATKYQISNFYHPKAKFSFFHRDNIGKFGHESSLVVEIKKLEEQN
ncbi:unnamed protein product [Meloidogyne enterolobii]|uniref:Uncharacterized protein n=1 Tax=Meloidogyne enterolobii TaxID=390850 RepID=A0ACB1AMW8_MELEN